MSIKESLADLAKRIGSCNIFHILVMVIIGADIIVGILVLDDYINRDKLQLDSKIYYIHVDHEDGYYI